MAKSQGRHFTMKEREKIFKQIMKRYGKGKHTFAQCCDKFGMGERSVYQWIRMGKKKSPDYDPDFADFAELYEQKKIQARTANTGDYRERIKAMARGEVEMRLKGRKRTKTVEKGKYILKERYDKKLDMMVPDCDEDGLPIYEYKIIDIVKTTEKVMASDNLLMYVLNNVDKENFSHHSSRSLGDGENDSAIVFFTIPKDMMHWKNFRGQMQVEEADFEMIDDKKENGKAKKEGK